MLVEENGESYRVDTNAVGDKFWIQDGRVHRTNGPAIEYHNGIKVWCIRGQVHRTDGPAALVSDHTSGDEYRIVPTEEEWWIDGRRYNKEQYDIKIGELQNAN